MHVAARCYVGARWSAGRPYWGDGLVGPSLGASPAATTGVARGRLLAWVHHGTSEERSPFRAADPALRAEYVRAGREPVGWSATDAPPGQRGAGVNTPGGAAARCVQR